GFQSGEVVLFRPLAGEVVPISREDHAVVGLAASLTGDTVVALSGPEGAVGYLAAYAHRVGYRMINLQAVLPAADPWLCPQLWSDTEPTVGLWDGRVLQLLGLPQLLPVGRWSDETRGVDPVAGLLLPAGAGARRGLLSLFVLCDYELGHWTEQAGP